MLVFLLLFIGITTSDVVFFYLGGQSLLAVTLINRINKNFDASIPLSALFRSPSIIELENILNNQN
jgi:acyl carrier protein